MDIGNKLKLARQKANYTQEQSATALNVSRQTISNWENNRTYPELSLVIKMSELYNISLDNLLKENSNYTNYLKMNTIERKFKIHITMILELLLFFGIWGLILFSYYSLPENSDLILYVVMVYLYIFPPVIFLFSVIIGADSRWGRFRWVAIPVLAYSVCFMDFCTFNTNSLFTGGDVFLGFAFEFFPFVMISFVGMMIGTIVKGAYIKHKKKKEADNGTGN